VHRSELARRGSDHLPIWAKVRLTGLPRPERQEARVEGLA
jgi:hypothetical protein